MNHIEADLRLAGFAIVPLEPTYEIITAIEQQADGERAWRGAIAAYEKEQGDG